MQVHRSATCTYHYISRFQKAAFLKNDDLVKEDIVKAIFFVVIESPHAPTQAKLVNQVTFPW